MLCYRHGVTTKQQATIHRGQALALCWLLQQPLGEGGDLLEDSADSRLQPAGEWHRVGRADPRGAGAGSRRFTSGVLPPLPAGARDPLPGRGASCPPPAGTRSSAVATEGARPGPAPVAEAQGHRLRRCRRCGAWFWRERKREYCGPASSRAPRAARSIARNERRRSTGRSRSAFPSCATPPRQTPRPRNCCCVGLGRI